MHIGNEECSEEVDAYHLQQRVQSSITDLFSGLRATKTSSGTPAFALLDILPDVMPNYHRAISFTDTQHGLQCELSFDDAMKIPIASLVALLCKLDTRVKPFLQLLTHWARCNKMLTLTPFMEDFLISIAMVFFCECRITPSVAKLQTVYRANADLVPQYVDGWDVSFPNDVIEIKKCTLADGDKSFSEGPPGKILFKLAFHFFEKIAHMDRKMIVFCPFFGEIVQKEVIPTSSNSNFPDVYRYLGRLNNELNPPEQVLCVQHPFRLDFNVALGFTTEKWNKFQGCCVQTVRRLKTTAMSGNPMLMDMFPKISKAEDEFAPVPHTEPPTVRRTYDYYDSSFPLIQTAHRETDLNNFQVENRGVFGLSAADCEPTNISSSYEIELPPVRNNCATWSSLLKLPDVLSQSLQAIIHGRDRDGASSDSGYTASTIQSQCEGSDNTIAESIDEDNDDDNLDKEVEEILRKECERNSSQSRFETSTVTTVDSVIRFEDESNEEDRASTTVPILHLPFQSDGAPGIRSSTKPYIRLMKLVPPSIAKDLYYTALSGLVRDSYALRRGLKTLTIVAMRDFIWSVWGKCYLLEVDSVKVTDTEEKFNLISSMFDEYFSAQRRLPADLRGDLFLEEYVEENDTTGETEDDEDKNDNMQLSLNELEELISCVQQKFLDAGLEGQSRSVQQSEHSTGCISSGSWSSSWKSKFDKIPRTACNNYCQLISLVSFQKIWVNRRKLRDSIKLHEQVQDDRKKLVREALGKKASSKKVDIIKTAIQTGTNRNPLEAEEALTRTILDEGT